MRLGLEFLPVLALMLSTILPPATFANTKQRLFRARGSEVPILAQLPQSYHSPKGLGIIPFHNFA